MSGPHYVKALGFQVFVLELFRFQGLFRLQGLGEQAEGLGSVAKFLRVRRAAKEKLAVGVFLVGAGGRGVGVGGRGFV